MSFSNTAAPFANGQNNFGQFWANPISCCANSAKSGDGFLLDMPTSSAKIDNGNLFGAIESNGLGMMVEMFCHVMAGAGQSNGTSNGEQKPDIKQDNLVSFKSR
jgi:LDH2 family malate/lactate/ureidoglycolate dehydrogenase